MKEEEKGFEKVAVFTGDPKADLLGEGKTLAKTEVAYHTAVSVQKPRDIDQIVENILKEAEFAGEEFYYQWPVETKHGKKIVEGGSIGLAISVAREWTNCAIPVEVWESDDSYTFRAAFVDLEKGFTLMRTFRQRKEMDIGKKYDAERKQDMIYQIGQSKAIRNVVLGAIPRWLMKKAIEKAKEAVLKHIGKEGIDAARNKAIDFFAGYGVEREQLIAFIGKKANDWTIEDVELLRTTAQRLKDGEVAVDELFHPLVEKDKPAPLTASEVLKGKSAETQPNLPEDSEAKGKPKSDNGGATVEKGEEHKTGSEMPETKEGPQEKAQNAQQVEPSGKNDVEKSLDEQILELLGKVELPSGDAQKEKLEKELPELDGFIKRARLEWLQGLPRMDAQQSEQAEQPEPEKETADQKGPQEASDEEEMATAADREDILNLLEFAEPDEERAEVIKSELEGEFTSTRVEELKKELNALVDKHLEKTEKEAEEETGNRPITEKQHKLLEAKLKESGIEREGFKSWLNGSLGFLEPGEDKKLHLNQIRSRHFQSLMEDWKETVDGFKNWEAAQTDEGQEKLDLP